MNSFRQLTACLAIALVSTLSSYYTTQSIDNSKSRIIELVNNNTVLEDQVKSTIIDKIKTAYTSKNTSFSKDMVDKLIKDKEDTVLASVPNKMKPSIEENFNTQTKEIHKVLDDMTVIKNDESNKVYNKCFLLTAVIAILGLAAVPFNKMKETELAKNKPEFVV
ncbi:hypothetical protein [Clostridium sp. YIM B02569]|uniref:hypothetical protein n=1 Tax=Clostridium sp. YIM B02569 TaxID=2911967 RepID=UPI001EEB1A41|nr:hypothetical protein [Clostridium sp. YIM B02569]